MPVDLGTEEERLRALTQISCPYLNGGFCRIASNMLGKPAPADISACKACTTWSVPRTENKVTASVAIRTLDRGPEKDALRKKLDYCIRIGHAPGARRQKRQQLDPIGVGTEVHKILLRIGFKPVKGCKCLEHAREMNRRGIRWCEQNKDTIVGWMEEEAERRGFGWVFSKMAARQVLNRAISRAKKMQKQAKEADDTRGT